VPAKLVALLLSAISLLTPAMCSAWGREGHEVVAEIAQQRLTPAVQRAVDELLTGDLLANGQPSGRTTLAQVSSWADEIKDTAEGRATARWHYENFPVCGTASPQKICPGGDCIENALAREIRLLADHTATPQQRNEALKWVVHLVADMHQPLHAADHDDSGGNGVHVSFFGHAYDSHRLLNLHSLWDTVLVRRALEDAGGAPAFVALPISPVEAREWEEAEPNQWMAESLSLARTVAYGDLGAAFSCTAQIEDTVEIGQAYYDAAAPVVRMRLRQAGVRLAKILNVVLDGS
jgi:hypothetical protein